MTMDNNLSHKTGIEDYYTIKNNKKMRFGYTTGTCAAAAAKGACSILLSEPGTGPAERDGCMSLITPKGIELCLRLVDIDKGPDYVSCGVVKDAGDDPDVTDGLTVYARVSKTETLGISIRGGKGVGTVTKKGLEQPVGNPAINRVPRLMIEEGIHEICEMTGYEGGIQVTVSVPGGEETALKTFNPRLGIEGGISILGTSGIVEPMSETALIKSIETEVNQQLANGRHNLIVTLGNYGKAYLEELDRLPMKDSVKCSNYIGEVIDMAVAGGAEGLLFIAHLGKFVKVAGGIMNTHSRCADSRMEIMASAALKAGLGREGVLRLLEAPTTDEGVSILKEYGLLEETMKNLMDKISFYLSNRAYGRIPVEALVFSNEYGYLGETAGCRKLIETIKGETNNEG